MTIVASRFSLLTFIWPLLLASVCAAREEPSFQLEQAAWNATHIVVATRAASDQPFRVLDSWKGNLKTNDVLELANFKLPAGLEHIDRHFTHDDVGEAEPPDSVSDERVVLFLAEHVDKLGTKGWRAATGVRVGSDFRPFSLIVSAVWIFEGKAFAVQQWQNPGPARMRPLRMYSEKAPHEVDLKESQVQSEVQRLLAIQHALRSAIAIDDLAKRAAALAPIVKSKSWFAWHEGFDALGDCQAAAVPVFCAMLADESLLAHHTEIILKLITLTGREIGPALATVVEDELRFWKETAPQLPKTWRIREGVSPQLADATHLHSLRLNAALEGLLKHPTTVATEPVRQTRDYWVSLPQLDGSGGRRHVSRLCARVLGAIETHAP